MENPEDQLPTPENSIEPTERLSDAQENVVAPYAAELEIIRAKTEAMRDEIRKVIVGQEDLVELLLVGLLSGGHCLVEGVPGIAKTLTSKLLAKTLDVQFSRIQFTPDLMPADVLGTNVFQMKDNSFKFNKGPIFSNVVLIDEINRAPAKTQSALFEVMEEKQISIDGTTYTMDFPFFVVATQNPLEQEGTYKLPEAQLDRFIFRIVMDYPSATEELDILKKFHQNPQMTDVDQIQPVWSALDLKNLQTIVSGIFVSDALLEYITKITVATRQNPDLFLGASPRATLNILRASKSLAAIRGRHFVTPDDIKDVTYPVLNHRLILSPEREMEGVQLREVIDEMLNNIEVPR